MDEKLAELVTDKAVWKCCICSVRFKGWGNNPHPFDGERCCDDCNNRFVMPVRIGKVDQLTTGKFLLEFLKQIATAGRAFVVLDADIDRIINGEEPQGLGPEE